MRCTLIALALFAVASAAPSDLLSKFEEHASQFGESFKNAKDEAIRAAEFIKHEKEMASHNADPNASFQEGSNENTDMTDAELKNDRLGVNPGLISPSASARKDDAVTSPNSAPISGACIASTKGYNNGKYYGTGPAIVDWGDKMTPVKDQGKCGSCWAFAAMCVLEARLIIKKGLSKTLDLSEQQLVDCSKTYGNLGCRGGVPAWAFNYVKTNKKVASEASYPYAQAEKAMCLAPSTGLVDVLFSATTANNVVYVPRGSEDGLLEGLKTGPVCVCIGVNLNKDFFTYKSGIYRCKNKVLANQIDHAIVLVGYTKDTYIVRNSWGCTWGTGGYAEIARGDGDMCGLAQQAQYPLL